MMTASRYFSESESDLCFVQGDPPASTTQTESLQELDRRIVLATQDGLPLEAMPYHRIGESLRVSAQTIQDRIAAMLSCGKIRRIGIVPNHYRLGFVANGMSVWDVPDDWVRELGRQVAELEFVSHCYRRPRHLPDWPYNLFAMVHAKDRASVEEKVAQIARIIGDHNRGHTILYSKRILKKNGLRIRNRAHTSGSGAENVGNRDSLAVQG